jgi:hypothetical protein
MSEAESDILLIVGGDFTPSAMGAEGYNQVLARARSRAAEYLDAFEALFLGTKFDAQVQSRLYLPTFLGYLREVAPGRVRALAAHLLKQYDAILVVFDQIPDKAALDQLLPSETANFLVRLNDRRLELKPLTGEP